MNKQRKIEKEFSRNLDCILAGKQVKTDTVSDADLRSTLDFAAKMAEIKPVISAPFTARLKAGLLEKLEKPEAVPEKHNWFTGLLQPAAWKTAAAVFVAVLVISLVWRAGIFNLSSAPQATTTPMATTTPAATATSVPSTLYAVGNLLGYHVNTSKPVYHPGEAVVINLTLKNTGSTLLTIEKLPPIISIMDAATGKPVYTFSGGKKTSLLPSGETAQFSYNWDQTDFNGRAVVGNYYLELEDMEYQGQTLQFQQPHPVNFEITPSSVN